MNNPTETPFFVPAMVDLAIVDDADIKISSPPMLYQGINAKKTIQIPRCRITDFHFLNEIVEPNPLLWLV